MRQPNGTNPNKSFRVTLQAFMSVVYMLLGVLIIAKQWFIQELSPSIALVLGLLVMAYGLFRAYRTYQLYKES